MFSTFKIVMPCLFMMVLLIVSASAVGLRNPQDDFSGYEQDSKSFTKSPNSEELGSQLEGNLADIDYVIEQWETEVTSVLDIVNVINQASSYSCPCSGRFIP